MDNGFPQYDVHGRVALVTAARRGLGRAIALAMAHAGADVALGLRDVRTGDDLARAIDALGRRALPLQMDMTRLDQVHRAVDDTVAQGVGAGSHVAQALADHGLGQHTPVVDMVDSAGGHAASL